MERISLNAFRNILMAVKLKFCRDIERDVELMNSKTKLHHSSYEQ